MPWKVVPPAADAPIQALRRGKGRQRGASRLPRDRAGRPETGTGLVREHERMTCRSEDRQ